MQGRFTPRGAPPRAFMPIEIERKFLVADDRWRQDAGPGQRFCQGYISRSDDSSVRVRLAAERAWLTVKGGDAGPARLEFEYAIPIDEAQDLLDRLCARPVLEKTRYRVPYRGLVWEVDVFAGHAQGLIVAEVELSEVGQRVDIPDWIGREVTGDRRYRNAAIVDHVPEDAL